MRRTWRQGCAYDALSAIGLLVFGAALFVVYLWLVVHGVLHVPPWMPEGLYDLAVWYL